MEDYIKAYKLEERIKAQLDIKKPSRVWVRVKDIFIEHLSANCETRSIEAVYSYRTGETYEKHSVKQEYKANWTAENWQNFERVVLEKFRKC